MTPEMRRQIREYRREMAIGPEVDVVPGNADEGFTTWDRKEHRGLECRAYADWLAMQWFVDEDGRRIRISATSTGTPSAIVFGGLKPGETPTVDLAFANFTLRLA